MRDPAPQRAPDSDRWGRYGLALVAYVLVALTTLRLRDNVVLLNWLVGPLFPVLVLYALPVAVRSGWRRWGSR